MATSSSNEDIIEKKASSPVATSCLVIACVALIGAIVFQLMEIGEYRSDVRIPATVKKGVGQDLAAASIKDLSQKVTDAIASSTTAGEGGAGTKLDTSESSPDSSELKEGAPDEEEANAAGAKASTPGPKAAPTPPAPKADAGAGDAAAKDAAEPATDEAEPATDESADADPAEKT